jgi:hypothetical protein
MAYRDDKEALLARAGALDRENDRLKGELDSAEDERDDLRDEVAKNDRELSKLRKKLAKHEKPPTDYQKARKKLVLGAAIGLVAMGGVAAFVLSAKSAEKKESFDVETTEVAAPSSRQTADLHMKTPGAKPEPEAKLYDPALAEFNAVYTVRWCLDTTDFRMRAILLMDQVVEKRLPWEFEGKETDLAEGCHRNLTLIGDDDAVPSLTAPLKAYGDALAALHPVAREISRYYDEEDYADDDYAGAKELVATLQRDGATYLAASDALREVFMPVFHRVRSEEGERLRASAPAQHTAWLAASNATDLMDALFAAPLSFERVDVAMKAINEFRAANSGLEAKRAVTSFYKFSKRVFRSLREQGSEPVLGTQDIHELRMVISYFDMAKFAQQGPSARESLAE